MSRIISEKVKIQQKIVGGIREKITLISEKGISEEQLKKLAEDLEEIGKRNLELEKDKTEIRLRARTFNHDVARINNKIKNLKKLVKDNFEKDKWIEFGILDKR